jgi:hypothetical protein
LFAEVVRCSLVTGGGLSAFGTGAAASALRPAKTTDSAKVGRIVGSSERDSSWPGVRGRRIRLGDGGPGGPVDAHRHGAAVCVVGRAINLPRFGGANTESDAPVAQAVGEFGGDRLE